MDAVAETVAEVASASEDVAQPMAEVIEIAPEPKKAVKAYDTLEALLQGISEQDEQLKAMKSQLSEMLTTNAALKKGLKQVVSAAQQNDALEQELQAAKKKLTMLKTFING